MTADFPPCRARPQGFWKHRRRKTSVIEILAPERPPSRGQCLDRWSQPHPDARVAVLTSGTTVRPACQSTIPCSTHAKPLPVTPPRKRLLRPEWRWRDLLLKQLSTVRALLGCPNLLHLFVARGALTTIIVVETPDYERSIVEWCRALFALILATLKPPPIPLRPSLDTSPSSASTVARTLYRVYAIRTISHYSRPLRPNPAAVGRQSRELSHCSQHKMRLSSKGAFDATALLSLTI